MTVAYLFSSDFLDDANAPVSDAGRAVVRRTDETERRDRALADALCGSDEPMARIAFDRVLSLYGDRLVRFAYGLVGSADAAEDVVQDVMVRVWDGRRAIQPEQSVRAYLFIAVRRRALDWLKHRAVTARHAEFVGTAEPVLPAIDEQLDAEVVAAAVRQAIERLSERRRTVIRLRYEEELPFAAIAEVMDISEKAAKDLAARAVREIRTLLGL